MAVQLSARVQWPATSRLVWGLLGDTFLLSSLIQIKLKMEESLHSKHANLTFESLINRIPRTIVFVPVKRES